MTLVNPKITKFAKQKDLYEEGCLSFPAIYAEVEVRQRASQATRGARFTRSERFVRRVFPNAPVPGSPNPEPRPAFSVFRFLARRRDRKPVSINNKYTLIPAEGCRKAMSNHSARLSSNAFISTRFPVPTCASFGLAPPKATHRASPAPPNALRRRRDPRACRSKRRTCPGRSSR